MNANAAGSSLTLKQLERLLDARAEHPEQAELLDAQIEELQQTIRTVEKREFPG